MFAKPRAVKLSDGTPLTVLLTAPTTVTGPKATTTTTAKNPTTQPGKTTMTTSKTPAVGTKPKPAETKPSNDLKEF
jgi:hypothetical protein